MDKYTFKICPPPESFCESKAAFTLAETIIILVVLGVVTMITIPNVIRRYQESLARTKIKKNMSIYDYFIQKSTIENELRSGNALKEWANDDGKCTNSRKAFRIAEGDGCIFKTTDGVYLDLTDILNPVIALSKDAMDKYQETGETDGIKSFKMTTSYDPITGSFRTNDLVYEQNRLEEKLANASEDTIYKIQDKVDELEKLYGFFEHEIIKHPLSLSCTNNSDCTKYEYDGYGNNTIEYRKCNANGTGCTSSLKYEYDKKGNRTVQYYCDGNGENCTSSNKFTYDENNNQTGQYYCDSNGINCTGSTIFEYDIKGNEIGVYEECNGSGKECEYSNIYTYDEKTGRQTGFYEGCNSEGKECENSGKYIYNDSENSTTQYVCNGNGEECSVLSKSIYDGKGNLIRQYSQCSENGDSCSSWTEYVYDENTKYYYSCNIYRGCTSASIITYDSKGNKTSWARNCDLDGENCRGTNTYQNSYTTIKIKR